MSLRIVFRPGVFSEIGAIMDYYERVAGAHFADDFSAVKIQSGCGFEQGTNGEDPHTADRLPPLQSRLEV